MRSSSSTGARIAHVVPWSTIGGTETATLRVAQAARDRGFHNTVFCLEGQTSVSELFGDHGFGVHLYSPVEPSARHFPNFARNSRKISRQMKQVEVDLVHCADILAAYHAALGGRMAGVRVLTHVRNRYSELSRRQKAFLAPVQRYAFVSRDSWSKFAKAVPDHRGVVVYDGIDGFQPRGHQEARQDVRRELGISAEASVLGMVARVAPQKDFETLISAAAEVVRACPNAVFLMVGEYSTQPSYRSYYRKIAADLEARGLTENFVFTDFRSDVARMVATMDIFVLSTHAEGLPLVILEAMAAGKAVVATAVDGIPEIVKDGETGFLCGHGDHRGLANSLLTLLRDPCRTERFGQSGRSRVERHFTAEAFGDNIAALYRETLNGGQDAPRLR